MTLEQFIARMKTMPGVITQAKVTFMEWATLKALANSQRVTPVRTGNLRRSETRRVESTGERGWLGSNVVYARRVHAREPFFERGIESMRQEVPGRLSAMGEEILAHV